MYDDFLKVCKNCDALIINHDKVIKSDVKADLLNILRENSTHFLWEHFIFFFRLESCDLKKCAPNTFVLEVEGLRMYEYIMYNIYKLACNRFWVKKVNLFFNDQLKNLINDEVKRIKNSKLYQEEYKDLIKILLDTEYIFILKKSEDCLWIYRRYGTFLVYFCQINFERIDIDSILKCFRSF